MELVEVLLLDREVPVRHQWPGAEMVFVPAGVVVVVAQPAIDREPVDGPAVLDEEPHLRADAALDPHVLVLALRNLVRNAVQHADVVGVVQLGRVVGLDAMVVADAHLQGVAAGDVGDRALDLEIVRQDLVVGRDARVVRVRPPAVAEGPDGPDAGDDLVLLDDTDQIAVRAVRVLVVEVEDVLFVHAPAVEAGDEPRQQILTGVGPEVVDDALDGRQRIVVHAVDEAVDEPPDVVPGGLERQGDGDGGGDQEPRRATPADEPADAGDDTGVDDRDPGGEDRPLDDPVGDPVVARRDLADRFDDGSSDQERHGGEEHQRPHDVAARPSPLTRPRLLGTRAIQEARTPASSQAGRGSLDRRPRHDCTPSRTVAAVAERATSHVVVRSSGRRTSAPAVSTRTAIAPAVIHHASRTSRRARHDGASSSHGTSPTSTPVPSGRAHRSAQVIHVHPVPAWVSA